jgi:hypothetical protein
MLAHQYTLYGFLGSLAMGSFLAIPYDLGVAALPLLGFLGATSLAALFVPGVPSFRRGVDKRRHDERRKATREHLVRELSSRVSEQHPHWQVYLRMVQRVASLRSLSQSRKSAFGEADVERLDDATVDYLGLWLTRMSMGERHGFLTSQNLEARITATEGRLAQSGAADRKVLEKALDDLRRLARSRARIEAHATSVDAAMLAMSDAFEEVYQGVMANPSSSDASRRLQDAVARMRIEDDLGSAIDEDLDGLFRTKQAASAQAAKAR